MQESNRIPSHVSIIMDGNGRWAKERGHERVYGHKHGVDSVRACVEQSIRRGVKYLSLFAFSEENWARPREEVDTLMNLMVKAIFDEMESLIKNGVRFIVLGNKERLSGELNEAISKLENASEENTVLNLIVFLSYSGKWDISQAARRMVAEGGENIEDYLVTRGIPDPDLIIRTSGEKRLSNYLLWQAAYAEFWFTDTNWPDFSPACFVDALYDFGNRNRRFGGLINK